MGLEGFRTNPGTFYATLAGNFKVANIYGNEAWVPEFIFNSRSPVFIPQLPVVIHSQQEVAKNGLHPSPHD